MASIKVPSPGRDILYKSKLGNYILPGKVVVTLDNLYPEGVAKGDIASLNSPAHVHAKVFSPGEDYVEENVPHASAHPDYDLESNPFPPGSWIWPEILPDRWFETTEGTLDGQLYPMARGVTPDWV